MSLAHRLERGDATELRFVTAAKNRWRFPSLGSGVPERTNLFQSKTMMRTLTFHRVFGWERCPGILDRNLGDRSRCFARSGAPHRVGVSPGRFVFESVGNQGDSFLAESLQ